MFGVVLDHSLDGLDLLEVVLGEGVPHLVGEVVPELLVEFGPHQEDFFLLLEPVPDHQRKGVVILIPTVLEFEVGQPVEEFGEVLFIPVQDNVEMRVAGDMAGVEFAILCEDLDLAEFELEVLHHDGVVAVVLEEHDVAQVLEAVGFVAEVFGLLHLLLEY